MTQVALKIQTEVMVEVDGVRLPGNLSLPEGAMGTAIFAHGSGSSRFSSRNQFVATVLNEHRLGTLLFDLLTEQENRIDLVTRELRFDIGLLGRRLIQVVDWVGRQPACQELAIGLFGASTGAAGALIAAAARPEAVKAVVSRGGRPDLAGDALPQVRAPTLLIIGGDDEPVIALNRQAAAAMHVAPSIEIVPGATHLFEEPGALEAVAQMAGNWFIQHLPQPPQ